jgi:hypothetical protein
MIVASTLGFRFLVVSKGQPAGQLAVFEAQPKPAMVILKFN